MTWAQKNIQVIVNNCSCVVGVILFFLFTLTFQENILKHPLLFVFSQSHRFRIYRVIFWLNHLYVFPKKQILADIELMMHHQSVTKRKPSSLVYYAQSFIDGICKGCLKTFDDFYSETVSFWSQATWVGNLALFFRALWAWTTYLGSEMLVTLFERQRWNNTKIIIPFSLDCYNDRSFLTQRSYNLIIVNSVNNSDFVPNHVEKNRTSDFTAFH